MLSGTPAAGREEIGFWAKATVEEFQVREASTLHRRAASTLHRRAAPSLNHWRNQSLHKILCLRLHIPGLKCPLKHVTMSQSHARLMPLGGPHSSKLWRRCRRSARAIDQAARAGAGGGAEQDAGGARSRREGPGMRPPLPRHAFCPRFGPLAAKRRCPSPSSRFSNPWRSKSHVDPVRV